MEGARTRDAHVIHHLSINPDVNKLLIINRPISLPELLLKKKNSKIKGKVLLRSKNCKLYEVSENLYVIDYQVNDIVKPFLKKKVWFLEAFGYLELVEFFQECVSFLDIEDYRLLTQNVFSVRFLELIRPKVAVFDAWDNFLLFPDNSSIQDQLKKAYQSFVDVTNFWVTNSEKNIRFYSESYGLKSCLLVKNGVDISVFKKPYDMPQDLSSIKRPIIGFGGKITHLFDYELFNQVVSQNQDLSFVLVGQILDKSVFSKIKISHNVHYLGDKHYSIYPSYVVNFDIGVVPYVTNKLEHGADSIKVYEYLAAGLVVIGTAGAGMTELSEYVKISKSSDEFSDLINSSLGTNRAVELPDTHTWKNKAQQFLDLFNSIENQDDLKKR